MVSIVGVSERKLPQNLGFSLSGKWQEIYSSGRQTWADMTIVRKEGKGDGTQVYTMRESMNKSEQKCDVTGEVLKLGWYQTASPISKLTQSPNLANQGFLKLEQAIWQAPVLKPELLNGP